MTFTCAVAGVPTASLLLLFLAVVFARADPLHPSADWTPNAGAMSYSELGGKPYHVDYDHRSVRINGQRVLLQSAGIHYPRSSPSMWPQLMEASRGAGLNAVQTSE
jgi:hypothetical protein